MEFSSFESRREAILLASVELGKAYGNMKFQEQMFREISQSFVKNATENGDAIAQKAMGDSELKPGTITVVNAPAKPAKASKMVKVKAEAQPETKAEVAPDMEVNTEEAPVKAEATSDMEVNTEEAAPAGDCPIKSVDDLRNYLTKRYTELGGTVAVRTKLLAALTEATGKKQAADVTPDKFAVAYAAINAVKA